MGLDHLISAVSVLRECGWKYIDSDARVLLESDWVKQVKMQHYLDDEVGLKSDTYLGIMVIIEGSNEYATKSICINRKPYTEDVINKLFHVDQVLFINAKLSLDMLSKLSHHTLFSRRVQ